MFQAGASPRVVAEDVLELLGGSAARPAYAESFGEAVPKDVASSEAREPLDMRMHLFGWRAALLIGWTLFGIAFALGLLAGWLIWG